MHDYKLAVTSRNGNWDSQSLPNGSSLYADIADLVAFANSVDDDEKPYPVVTVTFPYLETSEIAVLAGAFRMRGQCAGHEWFCNWYCPPLESQLRDFVAHGRTLHDNRVPFPSPAPAAPVHTGLGASDFLRAFKPRGKGY